MPLKLQKCTIQYPGTIIDAPTLIKCEPEKADFNFTHNGQDKNMDPTTPSPFLTLIVNMDIPDERMDEIPKFHRPG